jgi:hypothetical protein
MAQRIPIRVLTAELDTIAEVLASKNLLLKWTSPGKRRDRTSGDSIYVIRPDFIEAQFESTWGVSTEVLENKFLQKMVHPRGRS